MQTDRLTASKFEMKIHKQKIQMITDTHDNNYLPWGKCSVIT